MNATLENTLFDFETAKVQNITLGQLGRTYKENDVYGNPLKGIYHYDLMNQVIEMCTNRGYNADVWDLFAAQNKDRNSPGVVLLPQAEAQFGERAVEAHILRRVFANIRLTNFDDDSYTVNLAVAFHQRGIQIGFGNMVKICHNQCMLSPSHYIATYSEKGRGRGEATPLAVVLETVDGWLADAEQSVLDERKRIAQMRQTEISYEQVLRLIGAMTAARVAADTRDRNIREATTYPLNQAQITRFTEMILGKRGGGFTVWDMYNTATELYKANEMDIPALLPQNRAMVKMLESQFAHELELS